MRTSVLLALVFAAPLSAATISLSPSTPKAGDSVVITVHDLGSFCPPSTVTSSINGQLISVDVVANPATCGLVACPTVVLPVTWVAPAVTMTEAMPYTIQYAVTPCGGKRTVVSTTSVLVRPSCAFDRSLTVLQPTSAPLTFSWCDPSYSPFPDAGESATAYRIFVVKGGEAPVLVNEQSAEKTSASVALTNAEAEGAKGAFVEAELCEITIAGCRGSSVIRSNVVPLDVAPLGPCSLGGAALCLGGRFSVRAHFNTAAGSSSPAHPVPLTKDGGYFWFFGPDNPEVTVKIVDACSFTKNFWFFAAGMTDVGVDLVVQDTKTGVVRHYSNPAGAPFAPIQDTNAFAGCD